MTAKFTPKQVKKSKREPKGIPFVRKPNQPVLVKLREDWVKPNELQPTIYIGNEVNISKLMKFLEKSGVTAYEKQKLRKGQAVTVQFGTGARTLQIVDIRSQSGTFNHGQDGLVAVDPAEQDRLDAAKRK